MISWLSNIVRNFILITQLVMQSNQLISLGRIARLSHSRCLLGEPDIISIRQIKSTSSLFSRDKKIEDIQENYINGLIFPTTAHFSSFISSRYKAKDPTKHTVKAKLYMFDAYGEKDIQIQISIPGSMQVKAFSLKGQPLPFDNYDYERAYYSSFLRSLYPMNYPGIILYHLINRVEILRPIIKNFLIFSQKQYQLRELNNEFEMFRGQQFQENELTHNLSLQILIMYLLENGFGNLLKLVLEDLKKRKSKKFYKLEMEWKIKEKKFAEILFRTSEKLLYNPRINELKEFQIKALYKVEKYSQIALIGRSLIESGGTTQQISNIILRSLIEIGQDKKYLKTLNLLLNLRNGQQKKLLEVSHVHQNNSIISFGDEMRHIKCISQHTQLCFPFDNAFLNRTAEFINKRDVLSKNTKEGFTFNIIQKVQQSLNNNPLFYDTIVYFVKQRGWNSLVKNRANCFWLESDFTPQAEIIKSSKYQFASQDDNFSFFQVNFDKQEKPQEEEYQGPQDYYQQNQTEQNKQVQKKQQIQKMSQKQAKNEQKDFDGCLSQPQLPPKQMAAPPKCSSRGPINTARKFQQQERKIQCCTFMEQLFFSLFNDLKLQNSLENWQQKLKQAQISGFSPIKKYIAAIIYLKKGFLNRKLLQNKKCEQSFRNARKLSDSFSLNLVATYQLILLYIENKNVKGVEFYLVELVKILKNMGVQTFDIVPEWAKPILQFVVDNQGLSIVKNIHPLFKCVFGFYLRSNLSEEEVNSILKLKK